MSDQDKTQDTEEVTAEAAQAGDVKDGDVEAREDAEAMAAEQDPAADVARLEQQLAEVQKSLDEADLRAQAEIQNVRRRAERDVASAHKFAVEKFAGDILSVADSLERGLATMPGDDDTFKAAREGVELTLKVLLDTFQKHNIEQIDPKDASFDPEQHEAMTMVPMPGVAANTVIEVLEKGYTLNGRLIRPARVVVAKGE
ncbi:MAG: nucleotide exchange factor GrpE [Alcanivoracaceae bacterium]|nr:nucleotide exchange factor GrpE [Alcanivoracaceae bacterium]